MRAPTVGWSWRPAERSSEHPLKPRIVRERLERRIDPKIRWRQVGRRRREQRREEIEGPLVLSTLDEDARDLKVYVRPERRIE